MAVEALLCMTGIHKYFPGVKALRGVNLELRRGEVHALLGENGAGKSTLIKVLGGIYAAEKGDIFIDGQKVVIDSVNAAHVNGISIIHQELVLVPHMTVAENIFLGRELGKGWWVRHDTMEKEAQEMLDTYQMGIRAGELVKNLTIAQQQMVEIVKAVSRNSRILVMDEPTSSISDKEVEFLFHTMRTLTKKGVGIIYISHKMDELEQICDRVTVLRDGTYVGTKTVKETTRDQLIAMMVGRELTQYYTRDYQEAGEIILRCENISDGNMVKSVDFKLRRGEIIGLAGLVGAGRSETMKCLFGLTPHYTGDFYIEGQKVRISSPTDAMAHGLALVPEDRKLQGLYGIQSVRFNSTIEVLSSFIKGIWVDSEKEEQITKHYIEMMNTKTPSQEQRIGNLSGGNQQKVMIGRWLATSPKILILDEPTRGVDVGAKSEIYAIMNELVKLGMSIIMVSSELPEILNMSDRVYVMSEGRVTGCFDHNECVTQEQIMKLAAN